MAFIVGPPGAILSVYVQTHNLYGKLPDGGAFARTIYLYFGEELPDWRQGVAALGLYSAFLFFCLYMIRYMRRKLVAAKPVLLPILPEGEETLHKVFSRVSHLRPPIVIGAALMAVVLLQSVPDIPRNFVEFCRAPVNVAFLAMCYPLQFVIFGTFAWVYYGSIRGLYELGEKSLKLKSFREDKMLGARPIGSVSLSFAFAYFAALGMLGLQLIILLPNIATLLYMGLLAFLILLGVIFFFLPLNTVHKRMQEAKRREQEIIRQQFAKAVETPNGSGTEGSESSLSEMREALNRLTKVITVDVTKDEVEAIPTWPIDAQIKSRLATMIVTICAGVIVQLIAKRIFQL